MRFPRSQALSDRSVGLSQASNNNGLRYISRRHYSGFHSAAVLGGSGRCSLDRLSGVISFFISFCMALPFRWDGALLDSDGKQGREDDLRPFNAFLTGSAGTFCGTLLLLSTLRGSWRSYFCDSVWAEGAFLFLSTTGASLWVLLLLAGERVYETGRADDLTKGKTQNKSFLSMHMEGARTTTAFR